MRRLRCERELGTTLSSGTSPVNAHSVGYWWVGGQVLHRYTSTYRYRLLIPVPGTAPACARITLAETLRALLEAFPILAGSKSAVSWKVGVVGVIGVVGDIDGWELAPFLGDLFVGLPKARR